ncbi:DDE superfamily endonuclease [Mesorhizobium muleiense]|uniref:DDE superfamily endonuclease n=1 Tax=Mesorhizobium muleiense TaxID=1004279 RepID=A0A1G9DPC5_9HYPH|nr:DDE superfamily endonuclease [Mesorhizobium muleiense]
MPMERKSVEPLAAVTAPSRVAAKHQSLLHFVGQAPWSGAALLARVRDWVLPRIEQRGPIRAWIVDDTGFPKKGKHSVGVARQYCGQLGKQDNCQIAVSLSIANDAASLPIAYELYLPHSWAEDPEQRKKAKIPAEITFRTMPQIALEQIRTAKAEGVAPGVVLADAGYGADGGFRAGLSELGLTYVVGVQPTLSVWRPGESPLPPKPWSGRGRPPSRVAEPTITSRSRPRPWPRSLTPRPGARSPGAKEPTPSSIPASPPCACGRHPGTTIGPRLTPKSGS